MHGVAESGSVRAAQLRRREYAAYMATCLLSINAWLSQKHQEINSKRFVVGSVCVSAELCDRNMIKLGIGFTQKTAEVSSPPLVYIDLLALLCILHA